MTGPDKTTEDEMYASLFEEFAKEEKEQYLKEQKIKADFKEKLKGLINVDSLYNHFDIEEYTWMPEQIVKAIETEEQLIGYPPHQCARIVNDNDRLLYMKSYCDYDEPIEGIDYCYVWQITGMLGDDYSGYLLFPLTNGLFIKISYSC